jgi:hypothetical protein
VTDFAFPLHASLHGHHGRPEDDAALAVVKRRPDDEVGDAASSSIVMIMTPLTDPGFCRTKTRPAAVSHLPCTSYDRLQGSVKRGDRVIVRFRTFATGKEKARKSQLVKVVLPKQELEREAPSRRLESVQGAKR